MKRIQKAFEKKAYIGFLTAGDGGIEYSVDAALALIEGGVNLIELGVPFSDPVADGPVIQKSSNRALKHNITIDDVIKIGGKIREQTDVPLLLFSYLNPFLQKKEQIYTDLKESGFDGALLVDLPVEEGDKHIESLKKHSLAPVFLATPSTSNERIELIDKASEGFVYYACQKGTTGMKKSLPKDFEREIERIKKHTSIPVAVGFGISDSISASNVLKYADGFVVGSYFVNLMEKKSSYDVLVESAKAIDPRGRK